MDCNFVDRGSDSSTLSFIYSRLPDPIVKSLGIDLEKALSNKERNSLVLKEVVDKNGRRVKRWCKPGTDQPPRNVRHRVKRVKGGSKYIKPNDSMEFKQFTVFSDLLNKNVRGTRTGLGTHVKYLNYHHLAEHVVARKTYREDVLRSVKSVLENPVAVRVGKNESGTTEYLGYMLGHEGDTRYAIAAVVMDNFEPSGVGKLQTIMTAETYENGVKSTDGLNGSYKRLLDPEWKKHEKERENAENKPNVEQDMSEKLKALKSKMERKKHYG